MTERHETSQTRPTEQTADLHGSDDVLSAIARLEGTAEAAEQEALRALQLRAAIDQADKMEPGDA